MRTRNLWISCRCGWTGTDDALAGDLEHPECPRCGTTFTTYPSRNRLKDRLANRAPVTREQFLADLTPHLQEEDSRQPPAEAGEVR